MNSEIIWIADIILSITILVIYSLHHRFIQYKTSEILEHNKKLSENILDLYAQFNDLNKELVRISKENIILKYEIEKLKTRLHCVKCLIEE